MITQSTITVNDKVYTVNNCNFQYERVSVHDNIKVISFEKSLKQGTLQTINTIFEAASEEEGKNEIKRLNLEYTPINKSGSIVSS